MDKYKEVRHRHVEKRNVG